jgi:TonB-linked SusC/RagA family outer membrane protein
MRETKRLLHCGILLFLFLLHAFSSVAFQSDRQVTGRVTGKDDKPLTGVSVTIKGRSGGTATDADGRFSISVPANATLLFSSTGYKSREWKLTNENTVTIQLEESASELDEVIVVGYGTQKKSDVTAAISNVNIKNLEKQPAANIGTLLQGQAPGVIVSTASGNPAGNPVVLVRGLNSINNDRPLYVVDGIPLGYVYDINPNDIESINILKDASAATIYGAQAAGGVIIITTKKGRSGEPRINYNGFVSTHQLNHKFGLLDKLQTNKVVKEAFSNDGNTPPAYALDDNKYANTDWRDAYFKNGVEQKHDIDVSAGNEKMNYRLSFGHWEHTGTIINSGSRRDNIRLNSELKLFKNRLRITPILAYTRFNNKDFGDVLGDGNAGFSDIMNVYATLPHKQIYDANSPNGYAKPEAILGSGNPVGERMLSRNRTIDDYFQVNLMADLQIWKGVSYNFSIGKTILNGYGYSHTEAYDFGPQSFVQNPSRFESRGRSEFLVYNHLLNYEKKLGDHNIKLLYGFSRQKDTYQGTTGGGNHLSSPLIEALSGLIIDGSADFIRAGGWNYANSLQSYFGRVNYNFDEKYFFQASVRRDGSSRFGSRNRYGTFYSFSAGWALHREKFFNVSWISELKPRISYGIVGNQNISNFQYLAKIYLRANDALLNYPFGTLQSQMVMVGAAAVALANDNIKWEETSTLNAGLSFGLLKNRITGSFDYFRSRTSDMLAETPIPASSGITILPVTNIADMENKGWEFTVTYRHGSSKDFNFDVTANFSNSQNKIIRLGYDEGKIVDGFVDFNNRPATITQKGSALASFFLYRTDGIFRSQAEIDAYKNKNGDLLQPDARPGDLRFVDTNGDGLIDDNDKLLMGNALPKLDFGITFNASYKNFDFTLFFNGKKGQKMYNGARMFLYRQFRSEDLLNAWSPSNTNSDIYRLSNDDLNVNFRPSNYFLEDASFIRLRNIQIGYSVPQSLISKAHLNRLRIYVGAFNLLTITGYSGFDPDLSNNGIFSRGVDRGYYPLSKSFVVGVNIGF